MTLFCFFGRHRWKFYQCAAHAAIDQTASKLAVVMGLCVCGWACRECGADR